MRDSAEQVVRALRDAGHAAYFAGGCVRDMLLGREPEDIDIATSALPEVVAGIFGRRSKLVGASFGVVLVREGDHEFEVATFRKESGYSDSRHPDIVVFTSAEEDVCRRDFTINGMLFDPVDSEVIDHVGGRPDLDARLIRAIGDPAERFAEDHLRMLRAVRFAVRFGFDIEQKTIEAVQDIASGLRTVSAERVRSELMGILAGPNRHRGWRWMRSLWLDGYLIRDVSWTTEQTASVVAKLKHLPENACFTSALAVILGHMDHRAEGACRRLTCTTPERRGVLWLLEKLPVARRAPEMELADIKFLMAHDLFTPLMNLLMAEARASGDAKLQEAWDHIAAVKRDTPADEIAPPPLINGNDLITMGLNPGPQFKDILDALYRRQLNGRLSERGEALVLAGELVGESA